MAAKHTSSHVCTAESGEVESRGVHSLEQLRTSERLPWWMHIGECEQFHVRVRAAATRILKEEQRSLEQRVTAAKNEGNDFNASPAPSPPPPSGQHVWKWNGVPKMDPFAVGQFIQWTLRIPESAPVKMMDRDAIIEPVVASITRGRVENGPIDEAPEADTREVVRACFVEHYPQAFTRECARRGLTYRWEGTFPPYGWIVVPDYVPALQERSIPREHSVQCTGCLHCLRRNTQLPSYWFTSAHAKEESSSSSSSPSSSSGKCRMYVKEYRALSTAGTEGTERERSSQESSRLAKVPNTCELLPAMLAIHVAVRVQRIPISQVTPSNAKTDAAITAAPRRIPSSTGATDAQFLPHVDRTRLTDERTRTKTTTATTADDDVFYVGTFRQSLFLIHFKIIWNALAAVFSNAPLSTGPSRDTTHSPLQASHTGSGPTTPPCRTCAYVRLQQHGIVNDRWGQHRQPKKKKKVANGIVSARPASEQDAPVCPLYEKPLTAVAVRPLANVDESRRARFPRFGDPHVCIAFPFFYGGSVERCAQLTDAVVRDATQRWRKQMLKYRMLHPLRLNRLDDWTSTLATLAFSSKGKKKKKKGGSTHPSVPSLIPDAIETENFVKSGTASRVGLGVTREPSLSPLFPDDHLLDEPDASTLREAYVQLLAKGHEAIGAAESERAAKKQQQTDDARCAEHEGSAEKQGSKPCFTQILEESLAWKLLSGEAVESLSVASRLQYIRSSASCRRAVQHVFVELLATQRRAGNMNSEGTRATASEISETITSRTHEVHDSSADAHSDGCDEDDGYASSDNTHGSGRGSVHLRERLGRGLSNSPRPSIKKSRGSSSSSVEHARPTRRAHLLAHAKLTKTTYIAFVRGMLSFFMPVYLEEYVDRIAEEEWMYRGTTNRVRFDVFLENFIVWPFLLNALERTQEYYGRSDNSAHGFSDDAFSLDSFLGDEEGNESLSASSSSRMMDTAELPHQRQNRRDVGTFIAVWKYIGARVLPGICASLGSSSCTLNAWQSTQKNATTNTNTTTTITFAPEQLSASSRTPRSGSRSEATVPDGVASPVTANSRHQPPSHSVGLSPELRETVVAFVRARSQQRRELVSTISSQRQLFPEILCDDAGVVTLEPYTQTTQSAGESPRSTSTLSIASRRVVHSAAIAAEGDAQKSILLSTRSASKGKASADGAAPPSSSAGHRTVAKGCGSPTARTPHRIDQPAMVRRREIAKLNAAHKEKSEKHRRLMEGRSSPPLSGMNAAVWSSFS